MLPGRAMVSVSSFISGSGAYLVVIVTTAVEERLEGHRASARKIREAARALGLEQVAKSDEEAANGMTAVCILPYPPTHIHAPFPFTIYRYFESLLTTLALIAILPPWSRRK